MGAQPHSPGTAWPGDPSASGGAADRTDPAPVISHAQATAAQPLDVSVIVPTRNAEGLVEDCLASIRRSTPRELIVVDGLSTDRTVEIARSYGAQVLSDEGRGLPAARRMGTEAAAAPLVALVDVDVRLGEGDLERLLTEFRDEKYTALQAGLRSVSGPGYWGRALAHHHRTGRSKNWFGVVATIIDRDVLLHHGFDERFLSGEDIDLRWRLQKAGAKIGVSRRTVVEHRFEDSWETAKGQFTADGHGLGRMISAHGRRALLLIGLPAAAAIRGIGLSMVRLEPQWIPYYLVYAVYNYLAMGRELARQTGRRRRRPVTRAGG
jgi:glycosyltransferase involved in cell wall biosynthesis